MAMPIGSADVTPWPVVRIEDGEEAGREDPHPTSPVKTGEGKRMVGASKAKRAAGTAPKLVLKIAAGARRGSDRQPLQPGAQ